MADPVKDAKAADEKMFAVCLNIPGQVKLVEGFFEKKLPLQAVKNSLGVIRKDAKEYESDIKEAEQALKKVKAAKTPDPKGVAGALEKNLKKAKDEQKKLEGHLDIFEKLVDKIEKEEPPLRKQLEVILKAAEVALEKLRSGIIALPGTAELLEDNFRKNVPVQAIQNTIPVYQRDVTAFGKELTTADSVLSSLRGAISKGKSAYEGTTIELIDTAKKVEAKLSGHYKDSKVLLGELIGKLNAFKKQLTALGG